MRISDWSSDVCSSDLNVLAVHDIRIDCDQDAVWLIVEPAGPACPRGNGGCFIGGWKAIGRCPRTEGGAACGAGPGGGGVRTRGRGRGGGRRGRGWTRGGGDRGGGGPRFGGHRPHRG